MSYYRDEIDTGDYFERLERVREIMSGDPDYDDAEAHRIAREDATKLKETIDSGLSAT